MNESDDLKVSDEATTIVTEEYEAPSVTALGTAREAQADINGFSNIH